MNDYPWEDEQEFLDEMRSQNIILNEYVDESGDLMITWDWEKLKALYPDVYKTLFALHLEEVTQNLSEMVDDGLIEMTFIEHEDGSLEEAYRVTELGKKFAEGNGLT